MIIDIILEIFEKMALIDLIKIRTLNKTYKHYIDLIVHKNINKRNEEFRKSVNYWINNKEFIKANRIRLGHEPFNFSGL
jgi:UDP-N-acetylglucosamine pyrophosphorylase